MGRREAQAASPPGPVPSSPRGAGRGLQHRFKWLFFFLHIVLPFQTKVNLTPMWYCDLTPFAALCLHSRVRPRDGGGCAGGLLGARERGERVLNCRPLAPCRISAAQLQWGPMGCLP